MKQLPTKRRALWAILLNIITLGFYSLYLVHAFAKETNIACEPDGKKTDGLLKYFLLSLVTLGIYGIVWTALLIDRRGKFCIQNGVPNRVSIAFYILSIFFAGFTLGIMPLMFIYKNVHQQNDVNKIYNSYNPNGESVN